MSFPACRHRQRAGARRGTQTPLDSSTRVIRTKGERRGRDLSFYQQIFSFKVGHAGRAGHLRMGARSSGHCGITQLKASPDGRYLLPRVQWRRRRVCPLLRQPSAFGGNHGFADQTSRWSLVMTGLHRMGKGRGAVFACPAMTRQGKRLRLPLTQRTKRTAYNDLSGRNECHSRFNRQRAGCASSS